MTLDAVRSALSRVRELPWRRLAAISAGAALAISLLLGLLVRLDLVQDEVDNDWMEEILEARGPIPEAIARVFDFIGGGWFAIWLVPVAVAGGFLLARRPWAALVFVLTSALSAGAVQLLKVLFGRARPADILIVIDSGSYPSGHAANAATVAVLAVVLLSRWWVAVAGSAYVVLMALSRTYLGAHWITDTIGGALLGAAFAIGAWAIAGPALRRERENARRRRSAGASVGP